MTDTPLRVLSVTSRAQIVGRRTLWRIRLSDGQTYATHNAWLASLAQEYLKRGVEVRVWSGSGWYYRELVDLKPFAEPERVA